MPLTLQQQLDEAVEARHRLVVGSKTVSVAYGDRRIEYTATQLADLDRYIADLRRQIAGAKRPRNRLIYGTPI